MTQHLDMSEVIDHALDAKALSQRWREVVANPRPAGFVGKIDLDGWEESS